MTAQRVTTMAFIVGAGVECRLQRTHTSHVAVRFQENVMPLFNRTRHSKRRNGDARREPFDFTAPEESV